MYVFPFSFLLTVLIENDGTWPEGKNSLVDFSTLTWENFNQELFVVPFGRRLRVSKVGTRQT